MTNGRGWTLAIALACSCLVAGCAEMDPIFGRRTTIGSLKTSVSQLEYDKEQLTKQVAELKAEHRRITNRLAQEESANGELTARLDDARVLLRSRGYDTDGLASPTRPAHDPDEPATTPAGRTQRPGRKPPFARIPGRVDPAPSSEPDDETDPFDLPSTRSRNELGPQSRLDDASRWRRVAQRDRDVR